MTTISIFGYGSLMNPASREKTLPGKRNVCPVALKGYRRKMNAPVNGFLYLNVVPDPTFTIDGVLIPIRPAELEALRKREVGYACVDTTSRIEPKPSSTVYTFIAPNVSYPKYSIPRSYLETILSAISPDQRQRWMNETIIENPILEDIKKPVYANTPTIKRSCLPANIADTR